MSQYASIFKSSLQTYTPYPVYPSQRHQKGLLPPVLLVLKASSPFRPCPRADIGGSRHRSWGRLLDSTVAAGSSTQHTEGAGSRGFGIDFGSFEIVVVGGSFGWDRSSRKSSGSVRSLGGLGRDWVGLSQGIACYSSYVRYQVFHST
eukprot:1375407-Amorphochlora_amoeboformis.AAC.3